MKKAPRKTKLSAAMHGELADLTAEILKEVKKALKRETEMKGQQKKYPDYAPSPCSQYMKWVAHLKNVPEKLLGQMAKAQEHADRARFEEGKAHNFWNVRAEGGATLPSRKPHDWKARLEWKKGLALAFEIEVEVAKNWPLEEIFAAKKKALEELPEHRE